MTATAPRFAARIAGTILAVALQACGDGKSTEPAKPSIPSMAAVSPLTQQAVVDHVAPSAPTVRVTDAAGAPLSGARVVFGGITDFPAVITGADGLATIAWKLTPTAGIETMTARLYSSDGRAPLGPEVTFIAKAIPDAVTAVRAYTNVAQVGFPLRAVAPAPAVVAVDQFSNGAPNVEVRFETRGGGTVSPASATTDANGVAYITEWKLGPDLGIDTLIARVGDLDPLYFTARASPTFHASAVVVANQTTCAISDGDVYCWGSNVRGKVNGTAPGDAFTFPQRIPLPAKAASISGAYNHECAITTEVPPQAYCWGDNSFGQLGVDVSRQTFGGPFRVPVTDGIASVAAGMDHTCGLTPAGVAYCWGNGTFGQLGTGQIAGCFVPAPGKLTCSGPTPVVSDARFVAVAAGASHTCGIASSAQLYCWGLNDSGQLGFQSLSPCVIENDDYYYGYYETAIPCALAPQAVGSATSVTAVAAGDGTCALGGFGGVSCFGPPGGSAFVSTTVPFTSLSPDASCAVALGGAAYCWTRAFDARTASFAQLDSVSQGLRVAAITGAAAHRCAILQSDGSLLCWGNNDVGQLGNGSTVSTTTPSPVIAPPPP
jgi:hypothetical protein